MPENIEREKAEGGTRGTPRGSSRNHLVDHGETQARALAWVPRREERVEDLAQGIGVHPFSSIGHRQRRVASWLRGSRLRARSGDVGYANVDREAPARGACAVRC